MTIAESGCQHHFRTSTERERERERRGEERRRRSNSRGRAHAKADGYFLQIRNGLITTPHSS